MFNEFEYPTGDLINSFELMLMMVAVKYKVSLKSAPRDIAKRLLNEIHEFEPLEKGKGT